MFHIPELLHIVNRGRNVFAAVADQCQFGRRWRKTTKIVIGNVCELDILRLNKRCTGCRGLL